MLTIAKYQRALATRTYFTTEASNTPLTKHTVELLVVGIRCRHICCMGRVICGNKTRIFWNPPTCTTCFGILCSKAKQRIQIVRSSHRVRKNHWHSPVLEVSQEQTWKDSFALLLRLNGIDLGWNQDSKPVMKMNPPLLLPSRRVGSRKYSLSKEQWKNNVFLGSQYSTWGGRQVQS